MEPDPDTPPASGLRQYIELLCLFVLGGIGGAIADMLGMPLAWLVGAAIVSAALTLLVKQIRMPKVLYRTAQVVVGVAVGLTVSSEIFDRLGVHIALVPLVAIVSVAVGRLMAPLFMRFGKVNRPTAFFSFTPAGISEMADLAGQHGADVGAVATFHALRVFLIVLFLPPIIYLITPEAASVAGFGAEGDWSLALVFSLLAGLAGALFGNFVGLPSAFFIGPMVMIALLSGADVVEAREPELLLSLAQIFLGLRIGSLFNRETLQRLPRALTAGIPLLLLHAVLMACFGLILAVSLDLPVPLILLCVATGGAAEMVLTAHLVAVDVAMVALYQVTRGLLGNLLAAQVYLRTGFAKRETAE